MNDATPVNFKEALSLLKMSPEESGLRWVADRDKEQNPYIYLALEKAASFNAKAVYFRFFPHQGQPPKPQIYVYSFGQLGDANKEGSIIHHQLWNAGVVPFCFVYSQSQILVFNCSKTPKTDSDGEEFITKPHDKIKLLAEVQEEIRQYSARQFDSGLFWDSEKGKNFSYSQSAYEQLLEQLKNAKKNIIDRAGKENAATVKRLLMMLILIKYLEEREDEKGTAALNPIQFYSEFNPDEPTLSGILNNAGSLFQVLERLSSREHFNGQIFQLSDDEKKQIEQFDLRVFQMFVDGHQVFGSKHAIGQMSIWKLFSFNYLPIELISHIYEDFLADVNGRKKEGVVYTPPYLVQFLIDQTMPLENPRENFKILDPACGSGIFLVGSFKRLIQWWRLKNNWKKPSIEEIGELQKLLRENIYGCDIEEEAVRLTYFSLSLALLDALAPKEIWKNVHFENLMGQNLFDDFFKALKEKRLDQGFDLVIGNPPFKSEISGWAEKIDEGERGESIGRPPIPDKQLALLFLEQSLKLIKPKGNCCLILSSGPLLYNTKVHAFRSYLFKNFQFKEIYDFTPLRATLFKSSSSKSKPAAVAVLAGPNEAEKQPIYHFIFRRTRASGEKIEFEIDHYDIHRVDYESALHSPKVWQANFMGGGRLHHLLGRLPKSTVGDYLDKMVDSRGWKVGEGWIESANSDSLKRLRELLNVEMPTAKQETELEKLKAKYSADWITNKPYVETAKLTENGIEEIATCRSEYFLRPRASNKEIFEPPHLLIKEGLEKNKIPVALSEEYLTFKHSVLGVNCSLEDIDELKKLKEFLSDSEISSLLWLLSGRMITNREGVPLKGDILSLPNPKSSIEFNAIEKVLLRDILHHHSKFRIQGEKSEVLNYVNESELEDFGKYYCQILNAIYNHFRPSQPIIGESFICYPFVLGKQPELEIPNSISEIEETLDKLIDHQVSHSLWVKRILRIYERNVIFLYKPNQKRYWLKSIAVRDADETFVDLFNQGK